MKDVHGVFLSLSVQNKYVACLHPVSSAPSGSGSQEELELKGILSTFYKLTSIWSHGIKSLHLVLPILYNQYSDFTAALQ